MEIIEYNDNSYIIEKENWKDIDCFDIMPHMYQVSDIGRFRKKKNKKILFGNNSDNEKGYCRICLKSKDGKMKKYAMHRIVLAVFSTLNDDVEVNHKNGIKTMNHLSNLEESTRKENAEHAVINDLYSDCEKHYRSIFTNNEVHEICKRAEDGESISNIIRNMNLQNRGSVMSNIDKILSGKTWKKISSQYNIDYKRYHYKTYKYEDIYKLCNLIFSKNMKPSEIVKLFPQYHEKRLKIVIKNIKEKRLYKKIINEYECSTTRES